jgi:1,4-dihydroxy-6-naphthoate synthase
MAIAVKEISIAHSPDSDDAFMFYGLATGNVETYGIKVNQVMKDIQTLNVEARQGTYEVTAISFAAYPEIRNKYALMPTGSSMGQKYGPMVVAKKKLSLSDLRNTTIAIPGKQTSAYMTLRLVEANLNVIEMPFNQILEAVKDDKVEAGLIIHEGQLTYSEFGLHKLIDLGEWWFEETGLPLPLGGNAVRKDLGDELMQKAGRMFHDSVKFSLEHRGEALEYAMAYAGALRKEQADRFVSMYVNNMSVDFGAVGRKAIKQFFDRAFEQGVISERIEPEFSNL